MTRYLSLAQIVTSLERLQELHVFFGFGFFGFKRGALPIGSKAPFSYTVVTDEILGRYFNPLPQSGRYYNPFRTTSRWVSERYASTSLQRVITDTFEEAFIHNKGESLWGWKPGYEQILDRLMGEVQSSPIPLLDLAVWLYRSDPLPDTGAESHLIDRIISEFDITVDEVLLLCEGASPGRRTLDLSEEVTPTAEILNYIGWPPGTKDITGVLVKELRLENVGPCRSLIYEPRERLNVITGDNSLGKTFLLDTLWWSLTGEWVSYPADPSARGRPQISYTIGSASGRTESFQSPYNRLESDWQRKSEPFEGLALYARHSGEVSVWDPVGSSRRKARWLPHVRLSQWEVWEGAVRVDDHGRRVHVSNGLVRDWINWQLGDERAAAFDVFQAALRELSPPDGPELRPGKPTNITGDSRLMPTVRLPYGHVPIVYASAGVQRAITLSYMLVWHWQSHLEKCEALGREPFRQMVVVLDELEAHLHPRWQRQILPALLRTIACLSEDLRVQVHVATHSPLVLASLEPVFSLGRDHLHHLSLNGSTVELEDFEFRKHGTIDAWLESTVFGLGEARSSAAERAIEEAKNLQETESPAAADVERLTKTLVHVLPDDDPFWVRWNLFRRAVGRQQ